MLALVPLFGGFGLVVALGWAIATGSEHVSAVLVAIAGAFIVSYFAKMMANDKDKAWLPTLILAGYAGKIVASWLRWWILVDYYRGSGDAVGYHARGIDFVHLWRGFETPPLALGTEAMEAMVGIVYVPYVPNFLGGFFMFATLAFFGQMFLYAAFRNSIVPRRNKLYAIAVFFVPTVVYWPSSIGKEALMMLGLGMSAYGISKLLNNGAMSSLPIIGIGLVISGAIRPHVAAMQVAGVAAALLFAKGGGVAKFPAKRLMLLGFVGAGLAASLVVAAANFGITLEDTGAIEGQVDQLIGGVEQQTDKGGSSVSGGFISSPTQFPEVAVRVLFRPLPNEAHNPPAFASSLEGMVLLLIVIWRLPPMIKRGWRMRRDPYLMFCFVFTIGFIIAFSAFLNLGLMARERSMVMPFLLAMLVGWGFGPPPDEEDVLATPEPQFQGIEALLAGAAPVAATTPGETGVRQF